MKKTKQIFKFKKSYSKKNIVFSGIQPSGSLHLGNYLGAIKNFIQIQNSEVYENKIFCIVDLHATTVPQKPEELFKNSFELACLYLACGLDPKKCNIYKQSQIKHHSELAWYFSCITPKVWLNKMTQFKEKEKKNKEATTLGLYNYPILMASDILLYASNEYQIHVPVGEDQTQHLELTSDIANRFNNIYKKDFFSIPKPIVTTTGKRIMSLRDGTQKMSKSEANDNSRINLTDSDELIYSKIKKSKSDSTSKIYFAEDRPEINNMLNIYSSLSELSVKEIESKFEFHDTLSFKESLSNLVVEKIGPISENFNKLKSDRGYIESVLKDGFVLFFNLKVKIILKLFLQ
jgi:tryptophanyl-tRNA synthetase